MKDNRIKKQASRNKETRMSELMVEHGNKTKEIDILKLKIELEREGIDTSQISQYKIDQIKRILEKSEDGKAVYRNVCEVAQQEYNEKINKATTEMQTHQKQFMDEAQALINQLKADQGIKTPEPQIITEPGCVDVPAPEQRMETEQKKVVISQ